MLVLFILSVVAHGLLPPVPSSLLPVRRRCTPSFQRSSHPRASAAVQLVNPGLIKMKRQGKVRSAWCQSCCVYTSEFGLTRKIGLKSPASIAGLLESDTDHGADHGAAVGVSQTKFM